MPFQNTRIHDNCLHRPSNKETDMFAAGLLFEHLILKIMKLFFQNSEQTLVSRE